MPSLMPRQVFPNLQKRLSFTRLLLRIRDKNDCLERVEMEQDEQEEETEKKMEESKYFEKLEKLLLDIELRDDLMDNLRSHHKPELVRKIQFLIALQDYQETQDKNKKRIKGKKLVTWFFQDKSQFKLTGIPNTLQHDIRRLKLEKNLDAVKEIFLTELLTNTEVCKFLSVDL